MSLASILEAVESFARSDIEALEHTLHLQRLRRVGTIAAPAVA